MFYAILRDSENEISDFIKDEDDCPAKWETEKKANEELKDHSALGYIDIIEID